MISRILLAIAVVALLANVFCMADLTEENFDRMLENAYRAFLVKTKRSPSMGLSLAEYMASPKGGENFHFIPSGRK